MKLKEINDVLEKLVLDSLGQLSKEYSKTQEVPHVFDFWYNIRQLDNDKNICFASQIDVRAEKEVKGGKNQVLSYKTLYSKWIIQRENNGTIEEPKYGKQHNVEEARNAVLREIIGKGVSGLALGLSIRTKDQIADFNRVTNEQPFVTEKEAHATT